MGLRRFRAILLVSMLVLGAGCSSVVNSALQKQPMVEQFVAGNIPTALSLAQKKHSKTTGTGDELVWLLECGSLLFYEGKYEDALNAFRRCEAVIEEYDERALISLRDTGSEALTILANTNALPYRGWCRDRVALGIYKALAYLGTGNEEAFRAQVKRLREEHEKIQEDYKKFFDAEEAKMAEEKEKNQEIVKKANSMDFLNDEKNSKYSESMKETERVAHRGYGNFLNPASLFLSGLALLRDGVWDNARIEFERLYEALPNNPYVRQYYVTALRRTGHEIPVELAKVQGFPFPLERDCVYVLYAHDRTATLEQMSLYFPLIIAWPVCVFHSELLPRLTVRAGGDSYDALPLADMDGIFAQEYSMRMPAQLTRTLISALIKEAAFIATMNALDGGGRRGHNRNVSATQELVKLATAATWKTYQVIFNTADTRCWNFLPKEICLTQLPMPANRTLTFDGSVAAGRVAERLQIPDNCGSAIVYVNAMTPANIQYQLFPLR